MRAKDNVTGPDRVTSGIALGALGVLAFSLTLPVTRYSVAFLDPWFMSFGRAAVAGVLAIGYLALSGLPRFGRARSGARTASSASRSVAGQSVSVLVRPPKTRFQLPTAAQLRRLIVVAFGVVIGFPTLTSIALTQATAAHGAVVIALLPAPL